MKIFEHPILRLLLVAIAIVAVATWSCSGDDDPDDPDAGEADVEDAAMDTETQSDPDVMEDEDTDTNGDPGEYVDLDLEPYLEGAPDPDGEAAVFEVTDEEALIEGASATGRVGDYVLENGNVRFVVQQDERSIGACPWGGNVIDAEYRSPDYGGDILGSICLFLNADQTFYPEAFDILDDGSERAAVLAVTGRTAILDYLNVEAMIAQMGGGFADLFELKPDDLLELRLTKYFILRPGDQGLRVVTAMRNDGEESLSVVASHLMVSGADGFYFNPLSDLGGFGYIDRGLADPNPDLLPFLALMTDDSGVAYYPSASDVIDADLPVAGAYLTIFNVAASVLGRSDIISTLLASEQELATMPGVLQLEPGDVELVDYWTYASDGAVSRMADIIYDDMAISTGRAEGQVQDAQSEPMANSRVTAVDADGRTMNQTWTNGDGEYAMRLPIGSYEISARAQSGDFSVVPATVTIEDGDTAAVDDVVTQRAGLVSVSVRTPSGEPTPGRVTLICDGACPNKTTSNEWDVTTDGLPEEWATVEWVGVSGDLEFAVPEGDYEVVVSRGLEWSVWPTDAVINGGEVIEVQAGESTAIDAEISQVVDSGGAVSADLHVHSRSSLDATTPHEDRVLTFLSEGMDVIVSSDHDEIADYGPAAEALGATDELVTLVGNEITTIDIGHMNGFPLTIDEEHRHGGALDWGAGEDLALAPEAIYDWIREFPGEQVVQLNHPDSSYFRFSDVVRGITYGDPSRMRVQTPDYDPDTGDTGLWTDDFSAMELMNGPDVDRYWGVKRWWFTMLGRGERIAGTAVTDTHTRYGRVLGGVPRTFVYVDPDKDSVATFDTDHFVAALNGQRAFGTNGPFVRVEATNDEGASATVGEVLQSHGQSVTFELTIEAPEWVEVDQLDMFMNVDEAVTEPGEYDTDPMAPTERYDIDFAAGELEVVATGDHEHRRYRTTVEVEVDSDGVDAYVVFVISGSQGMAPVLPDNDIAPMAFTNPVYLDADGQGYSEPHLAELAATEPPESNPTMLLGADREADLSQMTRQELIDLLRTEEHHHHGHHHH